MFENDKFLKMLNTGKEMLAQSVADTFSISSLISEKWLIEEEKLFDTNFTKAESIKSSINRQIVKELTNDSKKRCINEGEIRIIFDFNNYTVKISRENLFIFGKYKKFSRELSQSRWQCRKCQGEGCFTCNYEGKNYVSIEELIGEPFKKHAMAKNYSMHASGREDVDVINSAGRPFVIELFEPEKIKLDLATTKNEVNKDERLEIDHLKFVRRSYVELVANSHFDKEYVTNIELSKELSKEDIKKIPNFVGELIQQTPNRVIHRRSDLVRKRKIKAIKLIANEKNKITISILAEAGTYIKEFVSGDKGRTTPSISSLLSAQAKCINLEVVKIYDDFLDLLS